MRSYDEGVTGSNLWPNRPADPWRFSYEWGTRDAVVAFGPARSTTLLCVTNITLSNQGPDDASYFDVVLCDSDGSSPEWVFRVLVPGTTSLTFPFPTPLVLSRDRAWLVRVGPIAGVGLFQATLVGYVSHRQRRGGPFRDQAAMAVGRVARSGRDLLHRLGLRRSR